MNSDWLDYEWGDIATLEYGKRLTGYASSSGNVPVYGTNGFIGWHTEALCPHAGVIIGRKGAYRGIHYCDQPFFVIDTAFYLSPKKQLDTRWAYYELLTHDINSLDSGSAIPSTTREAFYSLPLRLPPLSEQRAIAHILGTLDDKIALNRRMNATLEGIAQAIFKLWFVDFDPVRAKAEGRDPGLPKHLADLFPGRFVESELGEIPEGWGVEPVSRSVILRRESVNPGDLPTEMFAHYSIPAYDGGLLPLMEPGFTIKSIKYEVPEGCILVSRLNPRIRRVWLPRDDHSYRAVCSTEFLVLLPGPAVTREFLYYLFSSDRFCAEYSSLATGTSGSHQRVRPEGLTTLLSVLPPEPLVDAFTEVVGPHVKLLNQRLSQSKTLADIRDTLLPKLISGELRVPDAEHIVGEHT